MGLDGGDPPTPRGTDIENCRASQPGFESERILFACRYYKDNSIAKAVPERGNGLRFFMSEKADRRNHLPAFARRSRAATISFSASAAPVQ